MCNGRRWLILINGTVQGVGFRPFVYRTARELGLVGHVCNTAAGVSIEVEGLLNTRNRFLKYLNSKLPPLAKIKDISISEIPLKNESEFLILTSKTEGLTNIQSPPDIAPCDECLKEVTDPTNRRYRYPFINCTNCGPRYTIIEALPYDRHNTTMNKFKMCPNCAREYTEPLNRRFHAQPNACASCGPKLQFISRNNRSDKHGGMVSHPLECAIASIVHGDVVAIKGIGGFHLACDATNDAAVFKLRKRKGRDDKPFATMVPNLDMAHLLCQLSDIEAELLLSPKRPIVLLRKKPSTHISNYVAPGNKRLGLMLPSSPLHHLLFSKSELQALVMTSGNLSDEPIAYINDDAINRLSNIADAFLTHDRDIKTHLDDSIIVVSSSGSTILRRARGYVPEPIKLNIETSPILALGADLKNAICLTKGHNAYLSQHLGDLGNTLTNRIFEDTVERMQHLLDIRPEIIACDMHPDYFSSHFARCTKKIKHKRIIPVGHHHAHIASCMIENGLPNECILGIALDGSGFGTDGTIWGGEILIANYTSFDRAARFSPVTLPGRDAAVKESWRMALAYTQIPNTKLEIRNFVKHKIEEVVDCDKVRIITEMITKKINCPLTSSCGRLFDAVAAIIGLCTVNNFEGQAAMMLEQVAAENETGMYRYNIKDKLDKLDIQFWNTIEDIVADFKKGVEQTTIAAKFHNTVVIAITGACIKIKSRTLNLAPCVCLSGGCFQNILLTRLLKKHLEDNGFRVYTHSLVPPNDGGIALGQAIIATHLQMLK